MSSQHPACDKSRIRPALPQDPDGSYHDAPVLSQHCDIDAPPPAPFVDLVKHGHSLARRAQKPRPQFFCVDLSDPESLAEDASLVTTARMCRIEAIVREFPKIDFGSISIRNRLLKSAMRVGAKGRNAPYRLSASKTFCDALPLTGMPFFCSKSAIAALVLVPIAPSGWPTS